MKEKVHLKKIGNSKGVILSKKILEAAGISDTEAELIIEAGREGITIKPSSGNIREGWSEAFREMRKNEDDKLIIPDVFEDESFE
ncbi:MAG: AbrB/MazE/SpoVT family DNA-binding domain-containing protein [Flavisolibacter sp.]|nr:AbrB/MazE/SpoVT family DNA-binding domain-containing protein [Flavisolibacter sp.]